MGTFLIFGFITTWLTPLWLVSAGVTAGLVLLVGGYLLLRATLPKAADSLAEAGQEGVLPPIIYLACATAVISVAGLQVVPWRELLAAVGRISQAGVVEHTATIPAASVRHELPFVLRTGEIVAYEIVADRPLTLTTKVVAGVGRPQETRLVAAKPETWRRGGPRERPFPGDQVRLAVTNAHDSPVDLRILLTTDVEFPEVRLAPAAALAFLLLVALVGSSRLVFPRMAAIAGVTYKEALGQPLFLILLALGATALVAFIYIPYHTLGEDLKMHKDSGLTLIMVLAIIASVWSAGATVADEIEGRTALTLLSKPVRRWQFVLGKFWGVMESALLLFVFLGFLFLATVSFKVVHDAREMSQPEPAWQTCCQEMTGAIPGLALGFLETMVMASISIAISTRLTTMPNLIICFSIYALGHLIPPLVNSSVGRFEPVQFVGQFLATVIPVLDHFNMQPAIAGGKTVPGDYLGWAALYALIYSAVAICVALVMFEDRDLA